MLCYSREEILIEILITDDLVWIFLGEKSCQIIHVLPLVQR